MRTKDADSGENMGALKHICQRISLILPDTLDIFGTKTFCNCVSIARYGAISKSDVIEAHIDLWGHQGGNGESLGFHQFSPHGVVLIDNIGNIQTGKTANDDVEGFMQCIVQRRFSGRHHKVGFLPDLTF